MPRKKTQDQILADFQKVHGNRYKYDLVQYEGSSSKVIITCSIHGEFSVTPKDHLNGVGCRKCYDDSQRTSKEEFVKRSQIHWGTTYDYSLFNEMPSVGGKVKIKCTIHDLIFIQEPRNHIRGYTGCEMCKSLKLSGNKKSVGQIKSQTDLNIDFVNRAKTVHGEIYDYSEFVYKGTAIKGKIICPKHGEFFQLPSNHLKGTKCPDCANEQFTIGTFREKCIEKGIDYHRALKRRQAGLSEEKIYSTEYIRNEREINKIIVFGEEFPNIEEATRILKPPASSATIIRWINEGRSPEEAFERIPNPGYADGVIYLITNSINEKRYVGLTVQTLERRWRYHQEQANANHIKSNVSLHAAIREFGADKFTITQIDCGTTKKDLEKKEREWIKKLNTLVPIGYNISAGGVSGGSNSKPTVVDGKRFKSVKDAVKYVSETCNISLIAAEGRVRGGRIDAKTPSKPGEGYTKNKLYKTWSNIIHVSVNPKSKDFIPNITVYEKWRDFFEFRNNVGEPINKEMVFKRIDQEKGFFPENCKWMTKSEASKLNVEFMIKKGTFKFNNKKTDK